MRLAKAALITHLLTIGSGMAIAGERCDIPGSPRESKAMANEAQCQTACKDAAWCKAWVYVTGWGRCFLKERAPKPVSLRFYAGHIETKSVNTVDTRTVDAAYDVDYSGKDMRKLPGMTTAPACGEACIAEPRCVAFAYLEGYRDCYLKETKGTRKEKVFHCGTR